MSNPITRWLTTSAEPADFYELLGLRRFEPDRDRIISALRIANREVMPYQNHSSAEMARRATELQWQLGRVESWLDDAQQLEDIHAQIVKQIERAWHAAKFTAPASSSIDLWAWLRDEQRVHPNRLAILDGLITGASKNLRILGWEAPGSMATSGAEAQGDAAQTRQTVFSAPILRKSQANKLAPTALPLRLLTTITATDADAVSVYRVAATRDSEENPAVAATATAAQAAAVEAPHTLIAKATQNEPTAVSRPAGVSAAAFRLGTRIALAILLAGATYYVFRIPETRRQADATTSPIVLPPKPDIPKPEQPDAPWSVDWRAELLAIYCGDDSARLVLQFQEAIPPSPASVQGFWPLANSYPQFEAWVRRPGIVADLEDYCGQWELTGAANDAGPHQGDMIRVCGTVDLSGEQEPFRSGRPNIKIASVERIDQASTRVEANGPRDATTIGPTRTSGLWRRLRSPDATQGLYSLTAMRIEADRLTPSSSRSLMIVLLAPQSPASVAELEFESDADLGQVVANQPIQLTASFSGKWRTSSDPTQPFVVWPVFESGRYGGAVDPSGQQPTGPWPTGPGPSGPWPSGPWPPGLMPPPFRPPTDVPQPPTAEPTSPPAIDDESARKKFAQAQSLFDHKDYPGAELVLAELESLFVRDRQMREHIQLLRERVANDSADQQLAEAASLLAENKFPEALAVLAKLDAEARRHVHRQRVRELRDQILETRVKLQLEQVDAHLARDEFDEALSALNAIDLENAPYSQQRLVDEKREHLFHTHFQRRLAQAMDFLDRNEFDLALKAAQEARHLPSCTLSNRKTADDLIDRIDTLRLEQRYNEALAFYNQGHFDEALNAATDAGKERSREFARHRGEDVRALLGALLPECEAAARIEPNTDLYRVWDQIKGGPIDWYVVTFRFPGGGFKSEITRGRAAAATWIHDQYESQQRGQRRTQPLARSRWDVKRFDTEKDASAELDRISSRLRKY